MRKSLKKMIGLVVACGMVLGFLNGVVQKQEVQAASSYVDVDVECLYDKAYECLNQINSQRAANGLSALTMDEDLMECAMQRAADIVVLGESYSESELFGANEKQYAHKRPDGTSYKDYVGRSTYVGENLYYGPTSVSQAVSGWMSSSSHRDNILKTYKSTGIGVVYCPGSTYGYYWVELFSYDSATQAGSYSNYTRTFSVPVSSQAYSNLQSYGILGSDKNSLIRPSSGSSSGGGSSSGWNFDGNGWWYNVGSGNYYTSSWRNIDGSWYYFNASGYIAQNEWRDGCWLSSNGIWKYDGTGSWKSNSTGWWFEDTSGWYASSCWQKIDGCWYYFGSDGYMVTNQTIDGYWIGADGVCK